MEDFDEKDLSTVELIYDYIRRFAGEYINRIRNKQGISLRELHRRTNISISVLSDLENGLKIPRIEILIKLLVALHIPLDVFFAEVLPKQRLYWCKYEIYHDDVNPIRTSLLNDGFGKDEIKEIINFIEFTKSKRVK